MRVHLPAKQNIPLCLIILCCATTTHGNNAMFVTMKPSPRLTGGVCVPSAQVWRRTTAWSVGAQRRRSSARPSVASSLSKRGRSGRAGNCRGTGDPTRCGRSLCSEADPGPSGSQRAHSCEDSPLAVTSVCGQSRPSVTAAVRRSSVCFGPRCCGDR